MRENSELRLRQLRVFPKTAPNFTPEVLGDCLQFLPHREFSGREIFY